MIRDLESDSQTESSMKHGFVHMILVFLSLWASFYGISARALDHLIKFLHHIFSNMSQAASIATIATVFPSSLYLVQKHFGLQADRFEKYVICKKCGSLYCYKECVETGLGLRQVPKVCNHIEYPNHPFLSQRLPCGQSLLKEIVMQNGRKLYPIKSYCYSSVVDRLSQILKTDNFLEQCEIWRTRNVPNGVLCDIYDGAVWKDFLCYNGRPFLSEPHHLGLMLNCDWFQPYKQTKYSVGVLYLTILNLPRSVRFRPENIIVAGIIPGPNEPNQYEMNSYLRPLVKELNMLWTDGFELKRGYHSSRIFAVLLATVCDIPATQKLCGFVGHSSHQSCCKCKKDFPYSKELNRIDFSGADLGEPRIYVEQKQKAKEAQQARTKTQRAELELSHGSRFTELMHLPYYDNIRFTIIDSMHNLFLGTAKRILQTQWLEKNLISKNDFGVIQDRISACVLPVSVGRIPRKISSAFFSLTADEWKNWTLLYSMLVLHDILPSEHLACWRLFVSACQIYCSPVISVSSIEKAHEYMDSFFRLAENLYGAQFLTINTHLHLHLSKCYADYGPCYGFWLFAFERYNGILGKYHTNQQAIEIQLMRRFMDNMHVKSLASEIDGIAENEQFLFDGLLHVNNGGTSNETIFAKTMSTVNVDVLLSLSTSEVVPTANYIENIPCNLLPPFVIHKFNSDYMIHLEASYLKFLPNVSGDIPQLCRKHKAALWFSECLNCSKRLSDNFVCIQAYWPNRHGEIDTECHSLWSGKVDFFFSQNIYICAELKEVVMAQVTWFEEHSKRNNLLDPIEIWCKNFFVPFGSASFIPVTRIHCFCIASPMVVDGENVFAVNPIRKKIYV